MAYLNPDTYLLDDDGTPESFLEDIMYRKEFAMYAKQDVGTGGPFAELRKLFDLNEELSKGNYLFLHAYQRFVENYFNPNNEFSRILISWQTGAGKTVPTLKMGINMLDHQARTNPGRMGNVIILGFSHATFRKELLQYPELGFLSREERREYQDLQRQAMKGNAAQQAILQEFVLKIKRRFTSKSSHRSRFLFMGYKQFANKLFIKNPKYEKQFTEHIASSSSLSGSEEHKLRMGSVSSSSDAVQNIVYESINITSMDESEILEAIAVGKIIVNEEMVAQFKNSLVICDEIHKVYNSEEKNNWGIAISTIMNRPGLGFRVIFLSATPINNNPTEIVDLLNMLIPPPHNGVRREDLFVAPNFTDLKPGALHLIGKLTAGRVSFLQDQDPKFYPRRIMHGESIKGIPLLKFVRCPMSKFHYATYEKVYTGAITQDSQNLIDFALPDPTSAFGMYQSSQITNKLHNATLEWKNDHGIDLQNDLIIGDILDGDVIGTYSTKFKKLLDMLNGFLRQRHSGKIFVYHDAVYISGVLFIQELLKRNGYLDESMTPMDDTLCSICGRERFHHTRIDKVAEESVADIAIESEDVQLANLVQVIDSIEGGYIGGADVEEPVSPIATEEEQKKPQEEYVNVDSAYVVHLGDDSIQGGKFTKGDTKKKAPPPVKKTAHAKATIKDHVFMPVRFIVAHSDIEKGYLNRNLEKFNHPDNLYGESIRIIIGSQLMKESSDLKAGRKCIVVRRPDNISSLIQIMGRIFRNYSCRGLPPEEWTTEYYILTSSCPDGTLGYEEEMYRRKILQYQTIQRIQRMMHIYAIDSAVNFSKISRIFNSKDSIGIDILPYTPAISYNPGDVARHLDTSTYEILYAENEVDMIVGFIKRAFIEWSPIWKFDDLWKFISADNSPFASDMVIRSSMLRLEYFAAALSRMVKSRTVEPSEKQDFMDKVFDPYNRYIQYPTIWGSAVATVEMVGEYYVLCPGGQVDPDLVYRHKAAESVVNRIELNSYVDAEISMDEEWNDFVSSYSDKSFEELDTILCSYSLVFHEYVLRRIIVAVNRILSHKTPDTEEPIPHWELTFYVRMLFAYDVIGIIIWASQDTQIGDKYKAWITPPCGFSETQACSNLEVTMEKNAKGSTNCMWCPANILSLYYSKMRLLSDVIGVSTGRANGKFTKKAVKGIALSGKVDASLYPVGFSLGKSYLYNTTSDGWMEYTPPITKAVENDIVIGYDERVEDELIVRFKLRNPVHKITKHLDVRKLEKGTACSSKSKEYLMEMADRLGLESGDKANVQTLCISIRSQLMYNEILERQKPPEKRKRWFYYVHESAMV